MILLDSSALVCAIRKEAGSEMLHKLVREADIVAVGAPTLLQAGMVLCGMSVDGRYVLEGFLRECQAEYLEFRHEHAQAALSAFLRYGKGRHPAALNFADCITYAFARVTGLQLVYKGEDFGKTDLEKLVRLA